MKTLAASIGFRVKTGRATAVLLSGTVTSPRVVVWRVVQLHDPAVPDSFQPYHAALERPAKEAAVIVRRASNVVHALALRATRELVDELRRLGHEVGSVGLVVGSDVDPATLANAHVRAHASEGRLFREVLEAAAAACDASCVVLVERTAYAEATPLLRRSADELKQTVTDLGRTVERPWAAEEKMATLAGWVALANAGRRG